MHASDGEDEDNTRTDMAISRKLDLILKKLSDVEDKLEGKIFIIEQRIDNLPTKEDYKALEDKIDDQENRSRRNNIILHNVPEKAEGDDCAGFVQDFIKTHMELETDSNGTDGWEIDRAHRSGPPQQRNNKPRIIFVKFLRYQDRVKVLKAAPKKLKDRAFIPKQGSKTPSRVYISDDVSERIRKQRQTLVVLKKKIKERWPERKVFIPPTVPAILLRENEGGQLVRMLPGDKFPGGD